jgi:hypothetical protein
MRRCTASPHPCTQSQDAFCGDEKPDAEREREREREREMVILCAHAVNRDNHTQTHEATYPPDGKLPFAKFVEL